MKEDFLHFIWQHKLYNSSDLQTSDGESVEIIHPGRINRHAGPDFFDARLKIGQTLWAGNVEIHHKASDWNRHGHQHDAAYRNTILHVVVLNDEAVSNDHGTVIPSMQINWPDWISENYEELLRSHDWVNCASKLYRIDPFRIKFFLNSLMIEKLEQKIETITRRITETNEDWNEIFYQFLARAFGFRENNEPFERLARSLPQSILAKHHNDLFQIEALLFGQAGLLGDELFADDYYLQLRNEYYFLATKYKLKPIEFHHWKFMRMHPVNFPTVRLAQFAALAHKSQNLLATILEKRTLAELSELFNVKASAYWHTHYTFNKPSAQKSKSLGSEAFQLIMINVIIPFLFTYRNMRNQHPLKDRALEFLEQLPSENNRIIRKWATSGLRAENALESQALLHLQHHYCEPIRCLDCTIGQRLILHNSSGATI